MNLYTNQASNIRKTWLLMAIFLCLIVALGYFIGYIYNEPAILYLAILFSIVMNVASYWYSDKIVMKLSGAKEITEPEDQELWHVIENLAITAGLPMPKVFVIDDMSPNAFATGRNKEHSAVAVTTGLRKILNRAELEGVIAHELAHIGNRDTLLSMVVVVLVGFVSILTDIFIRSSWHRGGNREGNGGGVLVIIGFVLAILSPLIATCIQLAISRKREFLADASGVLLTRYPEGLANALRKISENGRPMQRASGATAHLYISNPFGKGGALSWTGKLFSTHPPVEERIKALLGEKGDLS